MSTKTKAKPRPRINPEPLAPAPLPPAMVALLDRDQVCRALGGCSRKTLGRLISSGAFPAGSTHLGERMTRWLSTDVAAWITDHYAAKEEGE